NELNRFSYEFLQETPTSRQPNFRLREAGNAISCPAMLLRRPARRFIVLLLSFLAAVTAPAAPRHIDSGFLNRHVKANGTLYKYQVYLPEGWTEHGTWPIILFLH